MTSAIAYRTNAFDTTTRQHVETVVYANGNEITYRSAPHPRFDWEDASDLITPELRAAMSVNENSVACLRRGVEITNCRVQNHPSRHGTVFLFKNPAGTFDMTINYRSKKMDPVELSNKTGDEITAYLKNALGI